jgi:hypothetical protein
VPACGTSTELQSRVFPAQISGWKARATKIRDHSCPFVVQKTHPHEAPSEQISGSKARATVIRGHSCPFVVQNNTTREVPSGQISGSKARATEIRVHSCPFVVQKTPLSKSIQNRSWARKPELQKFVAIRVQHTPSPFCDSRFARLPPPRYNFVGSAHRSLSVAPVVFPRNVHHGPVRQAPQRIH